MIQLIVLALLVPALAGCTTARTTEIRREPAKVRFIEIDTRKAEREGIGVGKTAPTPAPAPAATGSVSAMPLPALILSLAIAQPGQSPMVKIDGKGNVEVSERFQGVLRIGDAEGEKPKTSTPTGGASSTALDFVVNTTRVPAKGAGLLIGGAGLIAIGVVALFLGAGWKWGVALILAGGSLVTIGYLIDAAPWVLWLSFLVGLGFVAWCVWDARKHKQADQRAERLDAAMKPLVRAVEEFPLADALKAEIAKRAGERLPEVKDTIRAVKREVGIV
jgi:hypothetical protein